MLIWHTDRILLLFGKSNGSYALFNLLFLLGRLRLLNLSFGRGFLQYFLHLGDSFKMLKRVVLVLFTSPLHDQIEVLVQMQVFEVCLRLALEQERSFRLILAFRAGSLLCRVHLKDFLSRWGCHLKAVCLCLHQTRAIVIAHLKRHLLVLALLMFSHG